MSARPLVILASGSPRRRDLLDRIGIAHLTVVPPDTVENEATTGNACDLAIANAVAKAEAALAQLRGGHMPDGIDDWAGSRDAAVLIAADTIVSCGGRLFHKPVDADDARGMLSALSGRPLTVSTGVCAVALRSTGVSPVPPTGDAVASTGSATPAAFSLDAGGRGRDAHATTCETTRLQFRPLTPAEIDAYIATGEPFGKAGAFAWQGRGRDLIATLDGSESNVIGLPLHAVTCLLRALGLDAPTVPASL